MNTEIVRRKNMGWVVYILKCADQTYYTGVTNNLEQRLSRHENGTGARYTRGRHPFEIVYLEPAGDRSKALKRELEIKKFTRPQKDALIAVNMTNTAVL